MQTSLVVIPGWSEGPDPESRDSGFTLCVPRNDELSVRIGPFELAQQAVAAFDGEVEGCLRGALAAENLLQLFVDHVADQHEGAKPDSPGVPRRRLLGHLL